MSSQGQQEEAELTRKQRREQARAQRRALEEQHAASAKRRARLAQLGMVAAVVVVAVVVILIATGGKSGPPSSKHEQNATVAEISKLIGGIPQSGNVLGSPTAPVTLKYFGDLECPICRAFTTGALPSIIPQWVRTGKLRIEYDSMQTATHEPEVFRDQQVAAYAAGKQNRAWYFIETFYHEQGEEDSGYVTEQYLQGIARQVPGLNLTQWMSERSNPELTNEVETDKQIANNEGFTGTPSFLIGRSGGAMKKLEYTTAPSNPGFVNEAVEKLLKS